MACARASYYCVDGTNLVRTGYGYGGPAFRDQEEADGERLVALLSSVCAELSGRAEVELFFDGPWRAWRSGAANLRLCFTGRAKADELILDRVRARVWRGGRVTVVTADGELGKRAAEEGGRWQRVAPAAGVEGAVRALERRLSR